MVDTISNLRSDIIQTLSGTVIRLVEDAEENEIDGLILRDATGEVLIDAEEGLNLSVGEQVTIVGELEIDDEDGETEFEALKITKADGTVVLNPFETAGAGANDDILDGTNRRDTFDGGQGRDYLKGRGGNDNLTGGNGGDILIGGRGKDSLTGGEGRDEFVYESLKEKGDRITDFNVRQDVLNIDDVFEDDPFESTDITSFSQLTDFIKLTQAGSRTVVSIDPDGNAGSASFTALVTLNGVNARNLSAQNFVLD
ncbi:MAG: type I secretion C-terminal target domain-containing protein [Cyanobacteria bacterium CRU_2_1]|nr:type I secretion C-terminal target domain-containing protein [Cyanobacteria bacterium RU_5_0]NJR63435.1 type I secretion C-terminal target domain-containing protein [Cyanobacteria bacterium CRU_2_1]